MIDKITNEALDGIKKNLKEDENKIIFIFGLNGTGKSLTSKEFKSDEEIVFLGDDFENLEKVSGELYLDKGIISSTTHTKLRKNFDKEIGNFNLATKPNYKNKQDLFNKIFKRCKNDNECMKVLKTLKNEVDKNKIERITLLEIEEHEEWLGNNKDFFLESQNIFKVFEENEKNFKELKQIIFEKESKKELDNFENQINNISPTRSRKQYWNQVKKNLLDINTFFDKENWKNFDDNLKIFFTNEKQTLCFLCGQDFYNDFEKFKKAILDNATYRENVIKFCNQEIEKINKNKKTKMLISKVLKLLEYLKANINFDSYENFTNWVKQKFMNGKITILEEKNFYNWETKYWNLKFFLKLDNDTSLLLEDFKKKFFNKVKLYQKKAYEYFYSKYYDVLVDSISKNIKKIKEKNDAKIKNNNLFIQELKKLINGYFFFESKLFEIQSDNNRGYKVFVKNNEILSPNINNLDLSRSQIKIIELLFSISLHKHYPKDRHLIVDDPIDSNDEINSFVTKNILKNHLKWCLSENSSKKVIIFSHLKFTFKNLLRSQELSENQKINDVASFYNLKRLGKKVILKKQVFETFIYDFEEEGSKQIKEMINWKINDEAKFLLILNYFFINRYISKKIWIYDDIYLRDVLDNIFQSENKDYFFSRIKKFQFDNVSSNFYKYSEGDNFKNFVVKFCSFFKIPQLNEYLKKEKILELKNTKEIIKWIQSKNKIVAEKINYNQEQVGNLFMSFENHYNLISLRILIHSFVFEKTKTEEISGNFWDSYKELKKNKKFAKLSEMIEINKNIIEENIHQNKILKIFECKEFIKDIKGRFEKLIGELRNA